MASFLGGDYIRALPIVSSLFTVKDFQHNPKDDYAQFLISESDVAHKFPSLLSQLGKIGMVATVSKSPYVRWLMPTLRSARLSVTDGIVVTVHRIPEQKSRKDLLRFIPLALFLATIGTVFIDGMMRSGSIYSNDAIRDPFVLASVYTMSLMGILGVHEMGHLIAAKHHGIKRSWPYFVPMVPGLVLIPPTLGAFIRIRSHLPNRNAMFDVGISGPIAGLAVAIIVAIYGASISVLIPAEEAERLIGENQLMEVKSSLIMMGIMHLTGTDSDNTVLVKSPVMFASWFGFLLTFLNLVPAAQLDGGHITRATLGSRYHRIITFIGIGILFALMQVAMGILVLIIALRAPEIPPLDDVTPLSKGRRVLFLAAMAMAILCAPIPLYF